MRWQSQVEERPHVQVTAAVRLLEHMCSHHETTPDRSLFFFLACIISMHTSAHKLISQLDIIVTPSLIWAHREPSKHLRAKRHEIQS